MPIYQFKCTKCESSLEKLQKYAEAAPMCEHPEHGLMEKQFTRPAFHFKDGAGTDRGLLWSIPTNK
jgi:putative FmdB family regulatory protein